MTRRFGPAATNRKDVAVIAAVELAETHYMASDRTVNVNGGHGSHATRSERVGHYIRGGHTLCGRHTKLFHWIEPDDTTIKCAGCNEVPPGYLVQNDMLTTGLTYRQLDYWCRCGWLRPLVARPGSGTRRVFPPEELRVATLMAALTKVGVLPAAAELFARQGWLDLDGGVRLVLQ